MEIKGREADGKRKEALTLYTYSISFDIFDIMKYDKVFGWASFPTYVSPLHDTIEID